MTVSPEGEVRKDSSVTKLTVASGKGGTGKTTLSLSIARCCADQGVSVFLSDCDADDPNVSIFFEGLG